MKTIWSIIGVILQVIGNIFKRSDVLFLGYYLAGTGQTRSLPVYQNQAIMDERNRGYEWPDTYIVHTFHENHLYTTIGKAWVKQDSFLIYIKDTYKFYPVCRDAEFHFSDCSCENKSYANLYREVQLPEKIKDIVAKIPVLRDAKIDKKFGGVRILGNVFVMAYEISDKFWVGKGKPFEIYSEIPYRNI